MVSFTELFAGGYRDLIPVIPPGAGLAPGSKIGPEKLGKIPGRRSSHGLWTGLPWQKHNTTLEDVRQWESDGASIGLRAARFPGLDIDSLDEGIAREVEQLALSNLGPAPVRIGRAPKRLLMYRTEAPFGRMRLSIERGGGESHLIELLGDGQQYLVGGIHPVTKQPYQWSQQPPPADQLTAITVETVEALFAEIHRGVHSAGFPRPPRG